MDKPVAIIGCGIAGLSAAQALVEAGFAVQLFDKSRGTGGRMSSKRSQDGAIDLGAQYFSASAPRFAHALKQWTEQGFISEWQPALFSWRDGWLAPLTQETSWFVGTPRMSALPRHLLGDMPVSFSTRITEVFRGRYDWHLLDAEGCVHGPFSRVIVAVPAPQASSLLSASPSLASHAASVAMEPVWAVGVSFSQPLATHVQACVVEDSPLAWIACNNAKPQRDNTHDTWVLQANSAWTREHLNQSAEEITAQLCQALTHVLGVELPEVVFSHAQRWLYAQPVKALQAVALADTKLGLYACGDWCAARSVEGAWLSGLEAAQQLMRGISSEKDT